MKDLTKSPSSLAAHLGLGPRSSGCHLSYPLLFPMASCCIQRLNHFLPGPDSISSQVAPAQVCRSSSWRSSCPAADRSQQGSGWRAAAAPWRAHRDSREASWGTELAGKGLQAPGRQRSSGRYLRGDLSCGWVDLGVKRAEEC